MLDAAPTLTAPGRDTAEARIRRGVGRLLTDLGYGVLYEFRLTSGRRVDVIGLNDETEFVIVEIKSSVEDFRSDRKWREYLPFCERFYFAVSERFPDRLLPGDCGVIVADAYGGAVRREAAPVRIDGTRKRRQVVRFALAAAGRLQRRIDPGL